MVKHPKTIRTLHRWSNNWHKRAKRNLPKKAFDLLHSSQLCACATSRIRPCSPICATRASSQVYARTIITIRVRTKARLNSAVSQEIYLKSILKSELHRNWAITAHRICWIPRQWQRQARKPKAIPGSQAWKNWRSRRTSRIQPTSRQIISAWIVACNCWAARWAKRPIWARVHSVNITMESWMLVSPSLNSRKTRSVHWRTLGLRHSQFPTPRKVIQRQCSTTWWWWIHRKRNSWSVRSSLHS